MELDTLKLALSRLDERLDRQVMLHAHQVRERSRDRLESQLQPLARGQVWLILFGALTCFLGVAAWHGNVDHPGVFISGIILHAYGIVVIATAVVTKVLIAKIDYSEPVIVIQKMLVQVRRTALIAGMVAGMPWCVLWVPYAIATFAVLFGVDIASTAGAALWGGMAVVAAIAIAAPWLAYRWAKGVGRTRLAKGLEDIFMGARLQRAQAQLDEIARFERD